MLWSVLGDVGARDITVHSVVAIPLLQRPVASRVTKAQERQGFRRRLLVPYLESISACGFRRSTAPEMRGSSRLP